VLKWHKDGHVDFDKWEDLFEDALGFAQLRAKARSEAEGLAWLVLEHPVCYATYYAFQAASRPLPPSLGSDSESSLDYLDKDLRRLAPSAMAVMIRAAAYLKQHPDASLARLKADISKP
jgi:hypothetical protein